DELADGRVPVVGRLLDVVAPRAVRAAAVRVTRPRGVAPAVGEPDDVAEVVRVVAEDVVDLAYAEIVVRLGPRRVEPLARQPVAELEREERRVRRVPGGAPHAADRFRARREVDGAAGDAGREPARVAVG